MINMFRQVSLLFMTMIVVMTIAVSPVMHADSQPSYPDVLETNAHYKAIVALTEQDVMDGYTNGDFGVWDNVLRMQVAVMLANALNLEPSDQIAETLQAYSDIDEDFVYAGEVAAVTEAGIFSGSNGKFKPYNPITREQVGSVLTSGFSLDTYDTDKDIMAKLGDVSSTHKDNVQTLLNLGISLEPNQFKPGNDITRGAFATMLYRSQQTVSNPDAGINDSFEQQVVELTNKERKKHGLDPLKVDEKLAQAAYVKSHDMSVNQYFDHYSPTIGSLSDLLEQEGIDYWASAAENIAKGHQTPESVVNGWMNSPGHRENILNSEYDHIGVGFEEEGYYWTQEFIEKK